MVDPVSIKQALRSNTALVSVMLANNETGIVQPVREIAATVRRWNEEGDGRRRVLLHTDAAQVAATHNDTVCALLLSLVIDPQSSIHNMHS